MNETMREQFSKLWEKTDWEIVIPNNAGDLRTFKKVCGFFSFYVCKSEETEGTYVFSIEDGTGTTIFDHYLKVAEQDDKSLEIWKERLTVKGYREAMMQADKVIQQFMNAAMQSWFGFEISPTRPADEIRITQISSSDGDLFGVDEDCLVYVFLKNDPTPATLAARSGWFPVPMRKLTTEQAEEISKAEREDLRDKVDKVDKLTESLKVR